MNLYTKIREELKFAINSRNTIKTWCLKVIVAELQREYKKELPDSEVLKILKKLEKYACDGIQNEQTTQYLTLIRSFYPQMVTEEIIKKFIIDNVDFSKFKNNMQAISVVKSHFGDTADGKLISNIIKNWNI
jgi:uncharacterized protein YqeY